MGLTLSHFRFFELTRTLIDEVNQWIFLIEELKILFVFVLNSLISDIAMT